MTTSSYPSEDVLRAFGITVTPVLLKGGQGMTWRAGNVIVKPTEDEEETAWSAELINSLPQNSFRIAKHVKTQKNGWVFAGWEALEFIEGSHIPHHWKEKIAVCNGFNDLLKDVPKPDFIDNRVHPWAIAGKMAWDEMPLQFDERLTEYITKIKQYLKPVSAHSHIVHGDITGNMLFAPHLSPGIIDFTPVWRPKGYALAILVVDALMWEGADVSIFSLVKDEESMEQFLLRAALFRTLVTSEFYRQHGVDRFSEFPEHERVLNLIIKNYNLR